MIDTDLQSRHFYEYGGMIKGQNTKLHICDDSGNVLCGIQSNWMESSIREIFNDGTLEETLENINKENFVCKKCLKKWKKIKEGK